MATLKDVAKLACVDISTVSRALNNSAHVHPETKAKIMAAVKELSYHPNVMARALREGKHHTIGVVTPSLHLTVFAGMIQGIDDEARKNGYSILLCNSYDDPVIEKECLNRLRSGFMDGLIIAPTGRNTHLLRDIRASGTPVCQIVRQQISEMNSIVADYEATGYEAVHYLHRIGCRKIGLINGDTRLKPYHDRYIGYRRALEELQLPELNVKCQLMNNTFDYGYQCTRELLDTFPDMDAVMAAVDVHGLGAIRMLKERGIRIPEQMRVMSMTGHEIGGLLETSMTALEIPSGEMGRNAVRMLLGDMEASGGEMPPPKHLVFPASLVEREST